jgi:hypothetical protein
MKACPAVPVNAVRRGWRYGRGSAHAARQTAAGMRQREKSGSLQRPAVIGPKEKPRFRGAVEWMRLVKERCRAVAQPAAIVHARLQ